VNRRLLSDTNARQFVTVFYGILDPATGRLLCSNAGHCPPLHFRAANDRDAQELGATGIPLGVLEGRVWRREAVQIDPGDLLVLYTDGITEAQSEGAELFGEERLRESVHTGLQAGGPQPPTAQEIQDAMLADVQRFVGNAQQSDDLALAILLRD
jgi:sigma-B regulation protein RsbU (phosphoserine phosphatase)